MHYPEPTDSTALWAGLKAWVAVLDGLTMALTAGEVAKMAAITAGPFTASTTLNGREIGEILACTKKVLYSSHQSK
jgi:hypothetical protein